MRFPKKPTRSIHSHLSKEEDLWDRKCGKDADEDVMIQRIQRKRHLYS